MATPLPAQSLGKESKRKKTKQVYIKSLFVLFNHTRVTAVTAADRPVLEKREGGSLSGDADFRNLLVLSVARRRTCVYALFAVPQPSLSVVNGENCHDGAPQQQHSPSLPLAGAKGGGCAACDYSSGSLE